MENNNYRFVQFDYPSTEDRKYYIRLDGGGILRSRREQLGLTQQGVADRAGIKLPQYQRLETGIRQLSGCSMRIGLAICAVLLLDPYTMIPVTAEPPDPCTLKPQRTVNIFEVKAVHEVD